MALDFENLNAKQSTNEMKFGLCDVEIESGARISTNFDEINIWISEVHNLRGRLVDYWSIDKCAQSNSEKSISLCDIMMTCNDIIYFVELKHLKQNRVGKAFNQLESTIEHYQHLNQIKFDKFRQRKAIYINKKSHRFHIIEKETKQKFWSKFKTRISQDFTIVID